MVCQPVRLALLLGALAAVGVSPAWGNHGSAGCSSCAPGAGATTAPAFRTITCTECVPETYTVKRTCYRYECRQENYTAYRCETVPVCKERVCTVVDRVPCMKTVTKKVCSTIQTCEMRPVTKYNYSYVQQTCMQKKCVRRGHWECREVPACGLFGGFGGGHGHHNNCCDPCANNCCTPTRVKKVWVSCPEYIECPVTVCKKVCTPYTVMCNVPVCKTVWNDVTCQVCSYTCTTRQVVQKYTCCETRQVPVQCCRTVRVCVPYETCVTCTRYVTRQVCRQVPCDPCCGQNTCCNTGAQNGCCQTTSCCQTSCCQTTCCKPSKRLFGGFGGGCGHRNSCCCR